MYSCRSGMTCVNVGSVIISSFLLHRWSTTVQRLFDFVEIPNKILNASDLNEPKGYFCGNAYQTIPVFQTLQNPYHVVT